MTPVEFEKQLRRMERELLEKYLSTKRPIKLLPRLVAQLTEDQREKFFKLIQSIKSNNIQHAINLCERTIKLNNKE